MNQKGSLVIVGSGIKSLAHMTIEAQSWIRQADVVLYCLSDPATELWVRQNNSNSKDLVALYEADRRRSETYGDMVEHMLRPVREGKTVCGVFYGHPGLFVMPTHKAIEVARAEGYAARMLPGVSSADCLFADLGFDPAQAGCQFYEATDVLVHRRILHPENNVIIWQIGCVGDLASRIDSKNGNLPVLVEYLEQFYQPECEVVHYQGSIFPVCEPLVEKLPLNRLIQAKVTTMSTLYIPPPKKSEVDRDMAIRLGMNKTTPQAEKPVRVPQGPAMPLESGEPKTIGRSGLAEFILATATDSKLLTEFQAAPAESAALASLCDAEIEALLSRQVAPIRQAIKRGSSLAAMSNEQGGSQTRLAAG